MGVKVIYKNQILTTDFSKRKSVKETEGLMAETKRVLYKRSSVFPFTFFPDTIVLDQNKIEIVYGLFFFSKYVFTILVEDLRTVQVSTGLLFGSLQFELLGYEKNPTPINFLPKEAALYARQLIMGLLQCKRENIDMSEFSVNEARRRILEIGAVQEDLTAIM